MRHVFHVIKMARFALAASFTLACASILSAAPGDWPQWRGTTRDGLSTESGLLKEWPADGPKLLWKATGLGIGYSSVSISNGMIFTMGDHGEVADVMALDLDGKMRWTTKIGKSGGDHPGTRSTPTVDGGYLYAIGQFGDLVCIETGAGKEVWHKDLRKDLAGSMGGWGYAESPVVDGDKLLCTPGGKQGTVAAFSKKTGDILWRSKELTDGAQYSSLMVADIGGTHQYIVFTGNSVAGIATDGKVLWRADRKGRTAMVPTPVVDGNLVFVTSGYGVGCNLFKVTGSGADFNVEQVYENKEMQIHHGGVIDLNHNVYGATDSGNLVCMAIGDGSVLWKDKCVGKGSIAYADGHFYVRSERSGDVALVEASPKGYKQNGLLKQPDRAREHAWAHPVVAGGKLYLRDMDNLFCYDVKAK